MHLSQLTFIRTFSTIFWSSKFFLPPILTIVAWPPSAYPMDRSWALVSNLSADSRTCLLPSETVRGASRPPVSVFAPSETLHRTLPSKDLTVIPATSSARASLSHTSAISATSESPRTRPTAWSSSSTLTLTDAFHSKSKCPLFRPQISSSFFF